MGIKAGKIWGGTELIHANGVLEFHRINFNAGYKCSEHAHEFKWNGFFVESGKMIVRVWQDDQGLVDETILEAGDFSRSRKPRAKSRTHPPSSLLPAAPL